MKQASEKNYVVAVCLSAVFGVVGVQHFYLGRHWEGALDVFLTFGWLYYLATVNILGFVVFFGIDILHTFVTTILLLIRAFKDGTGATVCYPGQKLT